MSDSFKIGLMRPAVCSRLSHLKRLSAAFLVAVSGRRCRQTEEVWKRLGWSLGKTEN